MRINITMEIRVGDQIPYSCWTDQLDFGLAIGSGDTEEDCLSDLRSCYFDMIEMWKREGNIIQEKYYDPEFIVFYYVNEGN